MTHNGATTGEENPLSAGSEILAVRPALGPLPALRRARAASHMKPSALSVRRASVNPDEDGMNEQVTLASLQQSPRLSKAPSLPSPQCVDSRVGDGHRHIAEIRGDRPILRPCNAKKGEVPGDGAAESIGRRKSTYQQHGGSARPSSSATGIRSAEAETLESQSTSMSTTSSISETLLKDTRFTLEKGETLLNRHQQMLRRRHLKDDEGISGDAVSSSSSGWPRFQPMPNHLHTSEGEEAAGVDSLENTHGTDVSPPSQTNACRDTAYGEGARGAPRKLDPSRQADADHDRHVPVPYQIDQDTFDIPRTCPDDRLSDCHRNWLPGKPLRVTYVTWNLANREPRMHELASACVHPNAHLVIVSTQENGPYVGGNGKQRRWMREVQEWCLGSAYTVVGEERMWAIHLAVFARARDVAKYVSHVECSHVSTGCLLGLGGNKGGAAVAFALSMVPQSIRSTVVPTSPGIDHDLINAVTWATSVRAAPTLASFEERASARLRPAALVDRNGGLSRRPPLRPHPGVGAVTARHHLDANDLPIPMASQSVADAEGSTAQALHADAAPPSAVMTILCVGAHLAARQSLTKKRNSDYKKIVRCLKVGCHGKYRKFFKADLSEQQRMLLLLGEESGVSSTVATARPLDSRVDSNNGGGDNAVQASLRPVSAQERAGSNLYGCDLDAGAEGSSLQASRRSPRGAQTSKTTQRDVTDEYDLTLFGGDLNYRIEGLRDAIEHTVDRHKKIRSILMNNDQLTRERVRGAAFQAFQEAEIHFRPTYKYVMEPGSSVTSNNYSRKPNRLPSFCDRVLYKTRRGSAARRIAIRLYSDVPHVRTSDHRPVVCIFDVETRAYYGNS